MNNWYLLAAIPVFGLLVLVHEFGHFITAKWAGIRVEEFGLGFPPRIVGLRKRDGKGWEVIWFGGIRSEEDSYDSLKQTPFSGTSGGVSTPGAPISNHTIYSLNLIPIGQLDGGHVAYALWGSRQRTMAFVMLPILIVLGFVGWPGWWLWAFMAGLWGFGHPPVRDLHVPLGRERIVVGWIAFAVFVLTFAPVPFSFH